jgi:hypothetical protein
VRCAGDSCGEEMNIPLEQTVRGGRFGGCSRIRVQYYYNYTGIAGRRWDSWVPLVYYMPKSRRH